MTCIWICLEVRNPSNEWFSDVFCLFTLSSFSKDSDFKTWLPTIHRVFKLHTWRVFARSSYDQTCLDQQTNDLRSPSARRPAAARTWELSVQRQWWNVCRQEMVLHQRSRWIPQSSLLERVSKRKTLSIVRIFSGGFLKRFGFGFGFPATFSLPLVLKSFVEVVVVCN